MYNLCANRSSSISTHDYESSVILDISNLALRVFNFLHFITLLTMLGIDIPSACNFCISLSMLLLILEGTCLFPLIFSLKAS